MKIKLILGVVAGLCFSNLVQADPVGWLCKSEKGPSIFFIQGNTDDRNNRSIIVEPGIKIAASNDEKIIVQVKNNYEPDGKSLIKWDAKGPGSLEIYATDDNGQHIEMMGTCKELAGGSKETCDMNVSTRNISASFAQISNAKYNCNLCLDKINDVSCEQPPGQ